MDGILTERLVCFRLRTVFRSSGQGYNRGNACLKLDSLNREMFVRYLCEKVLVALQQK
jgi:hypothetical protein